MESNRKGSETKLPFTQQGWKEKLKKLHEMFPFSSVSNGGPPSERLKKIAEEALAPNGVKLTPEELKEIIDKIPRFISNEASMSKYSLARLKGLPDPNLPPNMVPVTVLPPPAPLRLGDHPPFNFKWMNLLGVPASPEFGVPGMPITPEFWAWFDAREKNKKVVFSSAKLWLMVDAPNVNGAIQFYKAAFGAEEVERMEGQGPLVNTAELKLGSFTFVVSDRTDDPVKSAFTGWLEVEDVVAAVAKSVAAGAIYVGGRFEVLKDRLQQLGTVKDPYGHSWTFCSISKWEFPRTLHL